MTDNNFCFNTSGGVEWLSCNAIPVVHGFSTRLGGVSAGAFESMNLSFTRGDSDEAVRENHRRFSDALGYRADSLVFAHQVHGDTIHVATRNDIGRTQDKAADCDALITHDPELTLMVMTADCCPVLLYDPVAKAVGAVHAGWRGTALSIAGKTVKAMGNTFGSKAADVIAIIGPCIGKCCFETHGDVPEAMKDTFGIDSEKYMTSKGEKYMVDIKGLNRLSLELAGVSRIYTSAECTCCAPDRYFSHRRSGQSRGSLASVICLKERGW